LSKAQEVASFKNGITEAALKNNVSALCNKEWGGRKFATSGESSAAGYIRDQFIKAGLTGNYNGVENYFQHYTLSFDTLIHFTIENKNCQISSTSDFFTWEFCFLPDTATEDIVYAGFGLEREDYSDYKNINVKDKWVVVELNSPVDTAGKLMEDFDFNAPINIGEYAYKKQIAQEHGAKGIILKINTPQYPDLLSKVAVKWHIYRSKEQDAINRIAGTYPALLVKQTAVDSLLGVKTNDFNARVNGMLKQHLSPAGIAEAKVTFHIDKQQRAFPSQNVIGIIPGKSKTVGAFITAHYDAVKYVDSLFFPGANDNASGSAGLIQLAKAFSELVKSGYQPEKTLVFIAFSGEEQDMAGSTYFIKHNPFPMDSSTIDINLDCIGIVDTTRQSKGSFSYVYSSEEVLNKLKGELIELADVQNPPLKLAFTSDFNYSDNASFTFNGIKAIFLLSGWGEMHTPMDKPEFLNYNNMLSVTRFVFDFAQTKVNFSKQIK
jgi:hypothetical protein